MKRIATAAAAATLSLSLVAGPAFAETEGTNAQKPGKEGSSISKQEGDKTGETKVGSSERFKACKKEEKKVEAKDGDAKADEAKAKETKSTGDCIQELIKDDNYKAGILGLLIGVPVALVALLGAAAAFSGAIPGVQLPALPF
ncbi:hypothetical protein HMPREF3145_03510 [Corynebacterium sp. HMSC05C01]|uniref:hypothetical protein n=1 Tax=Corynebacterium sp. HMSC05C01 TaxID=1581113 RepID=UPI0008A1742A|nr:hypothetical protein [Corynebacterium sp. HMSC05C01]OFT71221.1 hypothetical protein HMPREF3145_03510 [Corynebacterium sp. HMSC05C01]